MRLLCAHDFEALLADVFVTVFDKVILGIAEDAILSGLCYDNSLVVCFKGDLVSAINTELETKILGNDYSSEVVNLSNDFFLMHCTHPFMFAHFVFYQMSLLWQRNK